MSLTRAQIAAQLAALATVRAGFNSTLGGFNAGGTALRDANQSPEIPSVITKFNAVGNAMIAAGQSVLAAIAATTALVPSDPPPVEPPSDPPIIIDPPPPAGAITVLAGQYSMQEFVFSGSVWCPLRKSILTFCGGHSAHPMDVVFAMSLAKLIDGTGSDPASVYDYPMTPLETMDQIATMTTVVPNFNATQLRAQINFQDFTPNAVARLDNITVKDANGATVTGYRAFRWLSSSGVLWDDGTTAPQPFTVTFDYVRHLTVGRFWKVPGQSPALRPISRHTYRSSVWSNAINKLLVLYGNNGASHSLSDPVADAATGGNCAAYDPLTKEWTDLGMEGFGPVACEDPVSGNIICVDQGQWVVYDPRLNKEISRNDNGPQTGYFATDINYYPPTDKFYQLYTNLPDGPQLATEITLNRTTWALSFAGITDVNYRPRSLATNTHRYDSASKLIVGCIQSEPDGNTYAYGFKPLGGIKGQWLVQRLPRTGETTYSHHQVYIPELSAHAYLYFKSHTDSKWVLWRPDPAAWVVPSGAFTPAPTITVGGTVVQSLQEACDIGGAITLSAGTLTLQGAKIVKPVTITGAGMDQTIIDGASVAVEGKGVFDCWADATFVDLTVKNAVEEGGSLAAIKHENSKMVLRRVRLQHCTNGLLGGNEPNATVTMDACEVFDCGVGGDGSQHGVYIGRIASATVTNCVFDQVAIGHYLKSRAAVNVVTDNVFGKTVDDTKSYNVNLPMGGKGTVLRNTLRQGPNGDNNVMIAYGEELRHYGPADAAPYIAVQALEVSGCTFISTNGGTAIRNVLPAVVPNVHNNTYQGVASQDS